jgi:N-acetylglucosaminyldiphosphoundecaprenol N-acetyl-beta-D-mannosaminyltransferase
VSLDKTAEPVWVWGLPLAPVRRAEAVEAVSELVRAGRPSYFITASTHYAMLSAEVAGLRAVNSGAAFLVADGAPLVWGSRLNGVPLPERVAGSDLIYDICERAALEGFRVFLLGAAPGVAERAAARLTERYPALVIAGTECPPFRELSPEEHEALVSRIKAARPDVLFVAFGQPKGEFWVAENLEALGVPVCVQIGASLDFVSGRVRRAPRAFQKLGLEWAFRMALEPQRLFPRYARNGVFVARRLAGDLTRRALRRPEPEADSVGGGVRENQA